MADPTIDVLAEVRVERARQDAKHGVQDLPDGTGSYRVTLDGLVSDPDIAVIRRERADEARRSCDRAFAEGLCTYRHVLEEEVREAFAEEDPARLRAELVQVAAVAVKWVEAIDRRRAAPTPASPEETNR